MLELVVEEDGERRHREVERGRFLVLRDRRRRSSASSGGTGGASVCTSSIALSRLSSDRNSVRLIASSTGTRAPSVSSITVRDTSWNESNTAIAVVDGIGDHGAFVVLA